MKRDRQEKPVPNEIRTIVLENGKEELDEVVAGTCAIPVSKFTKRKRRRPQKGIFIHLERMTDSHWWMRINLTEDETIDVNFWTKKGAKIHARAERNL